MILFMDMQICYFISSYKRIPRVVFRIPYIFFNLAFYLNGENMAHRPSGFITSTRETHLKQILLRAQQPNAYETATGRIEKGGAKNN